MFDGRDLLKLPDDEMRKVRGDRIAMIFQQPTVVAEPGDATWATRSARCWSSTAA